MVDDQRQGGGRFGDRPGGGSVVVAVASVIVRVVPVVAFR